MCIRDRDIDSNEAREMAKITKGYADAFQELGVLYFKKKLDELLEDILPKLKAELFAYSYEKIWEEMTEMDRFLAGLLTEKEEYKREEVLKLMGEKSGSYSMYRDRPVSYTHLDVYKRQSKSSTIPRSSSERTTRPAACRTLCMPGIRQA